MYNVSTVDFNGDFKPISPVGSHYSPHVSIGKCVGGECIALMNHQWTLIYLLVCAAYWMFAGLSGREGEK